MATSFIFGMLAEKLRRAIGAKNTLPSMALNSIVVPSIDITFLIGRKAVWYEDSSTITGVGWVVFYNTSEQITRLKGFDAYVSSGTMTINQIAVFSADGYSATIKKYATGQAKVLLGGDAVSSINNLEIDLPKGWGIGVYVDTHSVNGVIRADSWVQVIPQ